MMVSAQGHQQQVVPQRKHQKGGIQRADDQKSPCARVDGQMYEVAEEVGHFGQIALGKNEPKEAYATPLSQPIGRSEYIGYSRKTTQFEARLAPPATGNINCCGVVEVPLLVVVHAYELEANPA